MNNANDNGERKVVNSLRDLPTAVQPPRDLWAGIEARIVAEGHAAAADPQDQGEVAHQPVIGSEHRSPKGARQTVPPASGQSANHFEVNALVCGHRGSRVDVGVVGGAGLGSLCKGQH